MVFRSAPLHSRLRGLAFVALTLLVAGCRFGNFSSKDNLTNDTLEKFIQTAKDGVTGFYRAAPTRLQYCAKLHSQQEASCLPGELAWGLADYGSIIKDPVPLLLDSSNDKKVWLISDLSSTKGLRLDLKSSTNFQGLAQELSVAELDTKCVAVQQFAIFGKTQRQTGLPTYKNLAIAGRLELSAEYLFAFEDTAEDSSDDCAASRADLEACHQDVTQCPGANATEREEFQAGLKRIFEQAIATGTMAATDIHDVEYFGYALTYE